ncbi:hypothetical protein [Sphingomonas mucosissima]|uniref:Uncharacterized protein n=1 Tax=Sphingomonas mucosissima TaxID=370959 RepID=A0A245ZJE5_9SPHN|nr:hypothetical protein [Sphingomonas mucosissima]OWK29872.1 hypothetical protein SPMU_22940 [Sphingomonas mucosissima]
MSIEVTAIDGMVRLDVDQPVSLTPAEAHVLTTQLVAALVHLAEPSPPPRRPHLVLVNRPGAASPA